LANKSISVKKCGKRIIKVLYYTKGEILLLGNKELYQKSQMVQKGEDLTDLIQNLHDTLMDYRCKHHAGRAIAAPQIGVKKRVIYYDTDQAIVFINPVLTFPDDEKIEILDDCMSFPNLLVKVMRYKRCVITFFFYLYHARMERTQNGVRRRVIRVAPA